MTTEGEFDGTVHPATLLELHNMKFMKLVGMNDKGNPIGILVNKDGKSKYSWTPIFENPHYWTKETLVKQAADFKDGVGVCLGDTGLKDEQGILYHNVLDIDSDAVYHKLFTLRDTKISWSKYSLIQKLKEKGCVIKTRKQNGFHIHWFSHTQHKPIRVEHCKDGFAFEIHTGKRCCPLPPTKHREDLNFRYKWDVKSEIPTSDDFYDIVLEVLNDCLLRMDKPLNLQSSDISEGSNQDSGSSESKHDPGSGSGNGNGNGKSDGLQLEDHDVEKIRLLVQPIYKQGHRNPLVFSLSCVFRRQEISKDSVIAVIENLAKNDTTISQEREKDIRKAISVVEDVFKDNIAIIAGTEYLKNVIYSITGSRDKAHKIFIEIFKIIFKVQEKRPDEEKQSIEDWLAQNVMAEYICMTTNDNRELFMYDEKRGVYLRNQEWRIRQLCRTINHDVKRHIVDEVIDRVKDWTYVERSKFDSDNDIVNVKNGLLNIHTLEFTKHSPNHLSTIQLPLKYDRKATCPRILKFLSEVLKPEDIRVILQLIGYCMYKTNRYERAFIFFGQGSNGKSTLIKLIRYFLGSRSIYKNISSVSLHDLAQHKFKQAELYGKLANLFADLGNKKICADYWGLIKMLISGDSMTVERKNRDPFEMTPFAKLVFSCNEIPELPDNTYATWRRLILLEFENVFEDNKDTTLIDKLTTEQELSGLLNMALIALRRLISNNQFDYAKDIATVRNMYKQNSDTLAKFEQERLEVLGAESREYEICRDVIGNYVDFCEQIGRKPKSDEQLGTYLKMALAGRWGGRHKKKIHCEQEYVYYGIRLKDKLKQDDGASSS